VFAARRFVAGELVERCEVLRIPAAELALVQQTVLRDYLFSCDDGTGDVSIALGCGSLYNHSDDPNAEYHKDLLHNAIDFTAARDIEIGDEITVAYLRVWLMDGRRPGSATHGPYLGPETAENGG
jgi:hypothetical protein